MQSASSSPEISLDDVSRLLGHSSVKMTETYISISGVIILYETKDTPYSGAFAEIIAVEGDSLVDIHALGKVRFEMKGGQVYRNAPVTP